MYCQHYQIYQCCETASGNPGQTALAGTINPEQMSPCLVSPPDAGEEVVQQGQLMRVKVRH
jgi:hypothetical protein